MSDIYLRSPDSIYMGFFAYLPLLVYMLIESRKPNGFNFSIWIALLLVFLGLLFYYRNVRYRVSGNH